jgi:signal transduction histidine kinase
MTSYAALVNAGLGLLTAGSGGPASPYYFFVPVVPIALGIIVPDEPGPPLAAGAVGLLIGLLYQTAGAPAAQQAFLVVAFGACTFYGWVAARLYRRLRERERGAAEAREQALADLNRSETRRALTDRLAALGRLAAGVAHEINNPLAYVTANVAFVEEALSARSGADGELLEALRESRGGLDRIKRIVHELRGFSRGSADGPGPTDALGALEQARRMLAARLPDLVVVAAPGLPRVLAQPTELVQVLVNLLTNAADAARAAGPGGAPGRVEVSATPVEGGLELAVSDEGPGFTPEALAHAFEPFFTTKGSDGTGLGLALSREFVERWGGRIAAANRAEGGARVVISLRCADGMDGPGRG